MAFANGLMSRAWEYGECKAKAGRGGANNFRSIAVPTAWLPEHEFFRAWLGLRQKPKQKPKAKSHATHKCVVLLFCFDQPSQGH